MPDPKVTGSIAPTETPPHDTNTGAIDALNDATGQSEDAEPPSSTSPPNAPPKSRIPSWKMGLRYAEARSRQNWDLEAASVKGGFSDKLIQRVFVRNVFGVLFVHLLMTFGIMAIFVWVPPVNVYAFNNSWLTWVALGLVLALMTILLCTSYNYVAFFAFTICEGCFLGTISAAFQGMDVIVAVAATTFIVLGITLYPFQSKLNFTLASGLLFVITLVLIFFTPIVLFFWVGRFYRLAITGVNVLCFSLYLVLDTQAMVLGRHAIRVSPEEYVLAAVILYLGIVILLMNFILMFIMFTVS